MTTDEAIQVGDVVLDLAQGRPMQVVEDHEMTADEWSRRHEYDLVENYGNSRLEAEGSDRVYECVYVGSIKNEPSNTYAFPESRLVRIEVEEADGGERIYHRIAVEVLEAAFDSIYRNANIDDAEIEAVAQHMPALDAVGEAYELASVEHELDTEDDG
jgi:hypothetical protein